MKATFVLLLGIPAESCLHVRSFSELLGMVLAWLTCFQLPLLEKDFLIFKLSMCL